MKEKYKSISIGLLILFALAIFLAIDAGYTYYHAVATAGQDGISNASLLYKLFGFPDSGWSIEAFYGNFKGCLRFLGIVLTANIGFFMWRRVGVKREKNIDGK